MGGMVGVSWYLTKIILQFPFHSWLFLEFGAPLKKTAGQFSVKLLFKNFPVVILCIGIILVFQNIIHGGW